MPVHRLLLAALILCCCACGPDAVTLEEYNTKMVTLPAGQRIRAEVMTRPSDMTRGMKFRDHLAPDRGMLFIHGSGGKHPYWMYEVRIPLDLLWLDERRNIVELYRNAEPCAGPADKCPAYGGAQVSLFVLELAGGMIDKYGLKVGQQLNF